MNTKYSSGTSTWIDALTVTLKIELHTFFMQLFPPAAQHKPVVAVFLCVLLVSVRVTVILQYFYNSLR